MTALLWNGLLLLTLRALSYRTLLRVVPDQRLIGSLGLLEIRDTPLVGADVLV